MDSPDHVRQELAVSSPVMLESGLDRQCGCIYTPLEVADCVSEVVASHIELPNIKMRGAPPFVSDTVRAQIQALILTIMNPDTESGGAYLTALSRLSRYDLDGHVRLIHSLITQHGSAGQMAELVRDKLLYRVDSREPSAAGFSGLAGTESPRLAFLAPNPEKKASARPFDHHRAGSMGTNTWVSTSGHDNRWLLRNGAWGTMTLCISAKRTDGRNRFLVESLHTCDAPVQRGEAPMAYYSVQTAIQYAGVADLAYHPLHQIFANQDEYLLLGFQPDRYRALVATQLVSTGSFGKVQSTEFGQIRYLHRRARRLRARASMIASTQVGARLEAPLTRGEPTKVGADTGGADWVGPGLERWLRLGAFRESSTLPLTPKGTCPGKQASNEAPSRESVLCYRVPDAYHHCFFSTLNPSTEPQQDDPAPYLPETSPAPHIEDLPRFRRFMPCATSLGISASMVYLCLATGGALDLATWEKGVPAATGACLTAAVGYSMARLYFECVSDASLPDDSIGHRRLEQTPTWSRATISMLGPNKCVSAPGPGTAPGPLRLLDCDGSEAQRWAFVANANGSYQIRNLGSGLCMASQSTGSTGGISIEQRPCQKVASQSWDPVPHVDQSHSLFSRQNQQVLSWGGEDLSRDRDIVRADWDAAFGQTWLIRPD